MFHKYGYIKLNHFYLLKNTNKRENKPPRDWENFIFNLYYQLTSCIKNINILFLLRNILFLLS